MKRRLVASRPRPGEAIASKALQGFLAKTQVQRLSAPGPGPINGPEPEEIREAGRDEAALIEESETNTMRTRSLPSIAALTVASLAFAIAPSEAHAQTQWNGYAPTYAAQPVAPAPTATVQPPTYYYPANPGGWQGYAPATAWRYYDPAAGWRYYVPGTASSNIAAAAPARPIRRTSNAGAPISSSNREYGTGRNVHMHKPWLPSSPR